jgi:hypothetical protein
MGRPAIAVDAKNCAACNKQMVRQVYNGRLEDRGVYARRKYCNVRCMGAARTLPPTSKSQLLVIARRLLKAVCERCGTDKRLQAHHVDGNMANNTPQNVMTLCISCHTKWHWEHGKKACRRTNGLHGQAAISSSGKARASESASPSGAQS